MNTESSQNKHLKSVFEVILPDLEKAKIDYFVYGGVGVAAYAGSFIRENNDVDIFVRDADFENAKSLLDALCKRNGLQYIPGSQNEDDRPKAEVKINGVERFSMIPIYQKDSVVVFKYEDGDEVYSSQILEKVLRNISGFRFFTPRDEFIKNMFINHISARPDKKERDKIKIDARAILNPEELSSFGF